MARSVLLGIVILALICAGCLDSPEDRLDLGPNQDPIANAGVDIVGVVNEPVSFIPAVSTDPDDDALTFLWEFGDGGSATTQNATHTYSAVGIYRANFTVTDSQGASVSDTVGVGIVTSIMDSAAVNSFIADEDKVNITLLGRQHARFGVEYAQGVTLLKDDGIQAVHRLDDIGAQHFEGKKMGGIINYYDSYSDSWTWSRDEVPDYLNPFENETALFWSAQNFTAVLDGSWTFKVELVRGQLAHVANTTVGTWTWSLSIQDEPRRLLRYEIVLDGDYNREQYLYDDEIDISVTDMVDRAPAFLKFDLDHTFSDGTLRANGVLAHDHVQEVLNSEIDLRVNVSGMERLSMPLTDVGDNITDSEGFWWNITWTDGDSDGFTSSNDSYQIVSNYTTQAGVHVLFYDHWVDDYVRFSWYVPVPPLWGLLLVPIVVALLARARKKD